MAALAAVAVVAVVGILVLPKVLSGTGFFGSETHLVVTANYELDDAGEWYLAGKYTYNEDGSVDSHAYYNENGTEDYKFQYRYEDGIRIEMDRIDYDNSNTEPEIYSYYRYEYDTDGRVTREECYDSDDELDYYCLYEYGKKKGNVVVYQYENIGSGEGDQGCIWYYYYVVEDGNCITELTTPPEIRLGIQSKPDIKWEKTEYEYDQNGLNQGWVSYYIVADNLEDALASDVNDAVSGSVQKATYEYNWLEEGKRAEITVIRESAHDKSERRYMEEYEEVPKYEAQLFQ